MTFNNLHMNVCAAMALTRLYSVLILYNVNQTQHTYWVIQLYD